MLKKLDNYRYLIPTTYKKGMQVEGLIYASDTLIRQIEKDQTVDQVANVATLPGWAGRSLAMPDAHQGYGFCIGGVAAADLKQGVVSAGGVGFDINCGVRLLASPWKEEAVRPKLEQLLNQLFRDIPCGTGRHGLLEMKQSDLNTVLEEGAQWAVKQGYGDSRDVAHIEDYGRIQSADPSKVSSRDPGRPASAQAACRSAADDAMSDVRGVVIQPSAWAAIQATVWGPASAPMTSGMCGWTGFG